MTTGPIGPGGRQLAVLLVGLIMFQHGHANTLAKSTFNATLCIKCALTMAARQFPNKCASQAPARPTARAAGALRSETAASRVHALCDTRCSAPRQVRFPSAAQCAAWMPCSSARASGAQPPATACRCPGPTAASRVARGSPALPFASSETRRCSPVRGALIKAIPEAGRQQDCNMGVAP